MYIGVILCSQLLNTSNLAGDPKAGGIDTSGDKLSTPDRCIVEIDSGIVKLHAKFIRDV